MTNCELLIRYLPSIASASDIKELLSNFGATHVHYFGQHGKMKNCAIAKFDNENTAKQALQRLHQLQIFDQRLVAVYTTEKARSNIKSSKESVSDLDSDDDKHSNTKSSRNSKTQDLSKSLPPVAANLGLNYPSPPDLHYLYPEANIMILTNIVNAMLAVPKFYTQVLHLMNRMNLPPPFAFPTPTPPMKSKLNQAVANQKEKNSLPISSEESEIESEDNESLATNVTSRKRSRTGSKPANFSKQLKLPKINQATVLPASNNKSYDEQYKVLSTVDEVFENFDKEKRSITEFSLQDAIQNAYNRNLGEKLELAGTLASESGAGFGTFAPIVPITEYTSNVEDDMNDSIRLEDLRANRMSKIELQKLSVYQNYERKEPTGRLYIKNLSDKVKESDLIYIYSRFINKDDNSHLDRFDVRLLTRGRMKGQAFVNLPDEVVATEAVNETHGYVLHGKPMIVDFAQSAKKKD
ncbi:uncharacterized protein TRIADDRAFT_58601 [Trichoplax adhaerens]|uniref:RNA-binding region-containing protein 3 n=1 Tax=Trichoplax adhaerens TaxID=10228 RepID=B3S354_TRIAD|nr:hypothetical protein TRIADDRAFT_58601 [Trichoplax adhaerens]EDV22730.1 hypothetical protein TRIADDRAFT_58601 [Trichoplax adhaerens]|eukprot:XP_002114596.1 hypothetical protein TRIADDRAFT_58601 [Trichoplax adhaerens]